MSTKEIAQDIHNIIQGAFNEKPSEVEHAFNSAVNAKMADAIEARRQEIGAQMTGGSDSEDV